MEKTLVEWTLDEEFSEVRRISLVTAPAVESDFMLFANEELKFKVISEEKRVVTGVAMRPNIHIPRVGKNNELYYGFFSEDTVLKACELFFRSGEITNNTNVEHQFDVTDIFVFESWIVEDPSLDKTKSLGLKDIRKGDWVVSMKIENDVVWEDFLKKGILKGFSVEIKAKENFIVEQEEDIYNFIRETLDSDLSDEEKYNLIKDKVEV